MHRSEHTINTGQHTDHRRCTHKQTCTEGEYVPC